MQTKKTLEQAFKELQASCRELLELPPLPVYPIIGDENEKPNQ